MKLNLDDEVWFKDQERDEEGYYIFSILRSPNDGDAIYVAVDCNDCFVTGRATDFTKCKNKDGTIMGNLVSMQEKTKANLGDTKDEKDIMFM